MHKLERESENLKKKLAEIAVVATAVVVLGVCHCAKTDNTESVDEGVYYYHIRAEPEEEIREPPPVDIVPETTDRSFDPEEWLPNEEYISLGEFETTAYSMAEGSGCGLTKTGTVPQLNYTVAVDPEVIPLGSIVVIDGCDYVAEDTGGLVKGRIVDIYMESTEVALEYGRQKHEVYIKITP